LNNTLAVAGARHLPFNNTELMFARLVVPVLRRGLASRLAPRQARSLHTGSHFQTSQWTNRFQHVLTWTLKQLNAPALPAFSPKFPAGRLSVNASIKQSLAFPTRVALSRPLGAPFLPRPPVVPRNITQIGLGSARAFGTARPIFQHLADKVPVTGRAFWELDLDTKSARRAHKTRVAKPNKPKKTVSAARFDIVKPQWESNSTPSEQDFALYFADVALGPDVVTYLDIPLAPTPTGRMPLAEYPISAPPMLHLLGLAEEHATHSKHSIRVASIFRRLDAARVWDKGAQLEAFGDRTGLCTVLRVKFSGWTKSMVRTVIGDGGKGWCVLMEVHSNPEENALYTSDLRSGAKITPNPVIHPPGDEARLRETQLIPDAHSLTFVMPSLDFSSSLLSAQVTATAHNDTQPDDSTPETSDGFLSDLSWESEPDVIGPLLTFSSDYWTRVEASC